MPFGSPPPVRVGRIARAIKRCLVGYGPMTTAQLVEHAYPRVKHISEWHWDYVRKVAARYAVRTGRRSRPLRWRLRDEIADKLS